MHQQKGKYGRKERRILKTSCHILAGEEERCEVKKSMKKGWTQNN